MTMTLGKRFCLFWTIVFKSFVQNRCPVRASALAYSNLLALVPVLALVISVTSGILKQDGTQRIDGLIENLVSLITPETRSAFGHLENDPRVTAARKEIVTRMEEFIRNTQSGTLGVTGVIALLVVGIGMLVRIENTFNDIWGISEGRSWISRIIHYWAALTLGPLLLVAAIALTGSPYLIGTRQFLADLPYGMGAMLSWGFSFLPFVILTLAFCLFYQLMPNTRVEWSASLVGGVLGGTVWQLNNMFSVFYASRVISNSYIYGSLGLVPVVMIGLYLSWFILLIGAQVAYVFQNRKAFFHDKPLEHFNHAGREWVAIQLMRIVAKRHLESKPSPSIAQFADQLSVPAQLVSQVLQPLLDTRLLVGVPTRETEFLPGRPIETILCSDILKAIRIGKGDDPLSPTRPAPHPPLVERLGSLRKLEDQAFAGLTLRDIALLPDESDKPPSSEPNSVPST